MRSARNIVAFPGEGKAPGGGKALGGGKTSRGGTNSGEDKRGQRDELAFLPAALEIVETPPSPTGRAIAITLIALFCLALAWASLGQVDIVASAPGKIVPTGRSKVIQPFETGVVRAIHVKDGQSVTAGETLIELDPTINEADGNRLRSDLMAARLDIARLRAALAGTADPLADFAPPAEAASAVIATQRQFLMNMLEEHRAKLAALDRQRTQKEAERASIAATIDKLQATIPIHQERVDIRKLLYDHQNGSKLIYLEDLQSLVENQRELVVAKSRYREAEAATAAIVETRAQMEAEYRRGLSGELAEAERKAAGLTEDLVKAEQRTKLQLLAAPVDGMVQQLAVHTVGGVVTPAQTLLVIAPTDSRLEIEAMVSNRDIGFIHAGQGAEIKVDTFSFTRYGVVRGEVLSVSQDAIVRDKPQGKSDGTQAARGDGSEPPGQELVFAARVSLDRSQIQVEDGLVNLSPGMAVTVEIKTGARRIISYLLSPLLNYRQASLRER
ncbi:hemolysin D [Rhizobiales bacterium GAS191]|jgi:hemolysin D|nr:hemolysin D [Rhizobiales bacterium GAS191]